MAWNWKALERRGRPGDSLPWSFCSSAFPPKATLLPSRRALQTVLLTGNFSLRVAHPHLLNSSLYTAAFQLKFPLAFSLGVS